MHNVLFVNEEKGSLDYFGRYFANHFKVSLCEEHSRGINLARNFPYDAVIVSASPERANGEVETVDTIKSMDGYNNCPIFIMSKDNSFETKIRCLKYGIDDFFWENMHLEEILLRITNNINRLKGRNILYFDDMEVDSDRLVVLHKDQDLGLTLSEFKIFKFLVINSERIVSRDELMEICWPNQNSIADKSLSTHITNLRTKINGAGVNIRSLRSQGIKLESYKS